MIGDVSALEKSKNPQVRLLAREVARLRALVDKWRAALARETVDTLLVMDPDGRFTAYGTPRSKVKSVYLPKGLKRANRLLYPHERDDLVALLIDEFAGKRHRAVFDLRGVVDAGGPQLCRTVEEVLELIGDKAIVEALRA